MLKIQALARPTTPPTIKVTFALPDSHVEGQVSVLGDFNGWDPMAHPLKKRSNGTRSVSVELPAGGEYQFKYLADGGAWFCDPHVDEHGSNEHQQVNSIVRV